MEKEFVPYKIALQLKELGFDEPCFGYFDCERDFQFVPNKKKFLICEVARPTFSQAFRWFREKYELRNSITDFIDDEIGIDWDYAIAIIGTDLDEKGNYKPLVDYSIDDETRKFKTYEEAELACLDKLIEIVKNKQ